jgi:hypothetical protein
VQNFERQKVYRGILSNDNDIVYHLLFVIAYLEVQRVLARIFQDYSDIQASSNFPRGRAKPDVFANTHFPTRIAGKCGISSVSGRRYAV